ncbi:MAG TPA: methionine biosynthesis protein MetW [Vitreimonas sp.]|uniref:methionine biosynthesis protein MetW n=1 Tax=Vitreimonas sp. TaxID=3069702 RepID=UPI002D6B98BC|nr:methionine biosynthesis protein MetW [Vitreimonas sp.]HYD89420.1 methionine biosynthesis protein MetW [Vitreimonas sp.]
MTQLELVRPAPLELDSEPRADHDVIAQLVSDGARVLDVGCGNGALMRLLTRECSARARGLELDPSKVHGCVSRGLSVVQGDAERDLDAFPTAAFDYVIFSHALMKLQRPQAALKTAARVGERVIVSINNAGHWRARTKHMFSGRLAAWADDAPCTVRDFAEMARSLRLTVERAVPLSRGHAGAPFAKTLWRANWFSEQAVFVLSS